MGLSGVKDNVENSISHHPFNEELSCEAFVIEHPHILDNNIKVPDSLDTAFQESRFEAHHDNFKLEYLSLLLSLFLVFKTAKDIINTLNNAFDTLSTNISKIFLRRFPKFSFRELNHFGAIFSNELFVIDIIRGRDSVL